MTPEELWDQYSETIGTDIDDLDYYAGKTIMRKNDFLKAITQAKKEWCKQQREICLDIYNSDELSPYMEERLQMKILTAPEPE